jgi:acetyltransferase-like isoleucine patch superfamily enzyme
MKQFKHAVLFLISPLVFWIVRFSVNVIAEAYWFHFKKGFGKIGDRSFITYPFMVTGSKHIQIGKNFYALSTLRMEAIDHYHESDYEPAIIIGDNVKINNDCHIAAINKIVIGNNVLFASRIFVTDHYHGKIDSETLQIPPYLRKIYSKGPVIIEDNVWIGEGVTIMPDVRIGRNSVIGAHSVVTKNIPENAVAAGTPAEVIRQL